MRTVGFTKGGKTVHKTVNKTEAPKAPAKTEAPKKKAPKAPAKTEAPKAEAPEAEETEGE